MSWRRLVSYAAVIAVAKGRHVEARQAVKSLRVGMAVVHLRLQGPPLAKVQRTHAPHAACPRLLSGR